MAGLIVTFGLHLDGQRAVKPADRLGEIVVGPLGLLNILETHLGLLGDQPSRAERIVQYRECLAKMDDASRFYHASFATDPLGTAATLLEWRDLWHLHGWDGGFGNGAASRLADLAAVEDLVGKHLAPSLGERLVRVRQELDARTPPIRSVRLVDSPEALPKRWRDVLEKLPATAVTAEDAAGEGFLGKLQAALRQAAAGEKTCIAWPERKPALPGRTTAASGLCGARRGFLPARGWRGRWRNRLLRCSFRPWKTPAWMPAWRTPGGPAMVCASRALSVPRFRCCPSFWSCSGNR